MIPLPAVLVLAIATTPIDGEVIAKLRPGADRATIESLGLEVHSAFPAVRGIDRVGLSRVVRVVDSTLSAAAIVAVLDAHGDIEWAEVNRAGPAILAPLPNDPLVGQQWHIQQANDIDMDLPEAWQLRGTFNADSSLVVAVVDSGFNIGTTVADLTNTHWVNGGEIAGNGLDDDANGFVDDAVGYDFVVGEPNPNGGHPHGIWISSILAARTNNGIATAGVAPGVKLMHLRAFGDDGNFPSGGPFAGKLAAAAALIYAVDNGADIINNSWHDGTGPTQVILDAVQYVKDNGVLAVFAAGNDGIQGGWPSQHPACFSVAGMEWIGTKWSSSNYGAFTDISAGGTNIVVVGETGAFTVNGTSASAPAVTGVGALLLSEDATLPRIALERLLELGSMNLDGLNPTYAGKIGAGFVNAERSLRLLLPATDLGFAKPGNTSPRLHAYGGTTLGSTFAITVSAGTPGASTLLVIGATAANLPFGGGVLVPNPSVIVSAPLDADGVLHIETTLPLTLPVGPVARMQAIVADSGATLGASLTNAVLLSGL